MQESDVKTKYFLIDEDLFVEGPGLQGRVNFIDSLSFNLSLALKSAGNMPNTTEMPVFRFGRMFRNPNLPEYRPDKKGLISLGLDMGERTSLSQNPGLPAGYVYLGQFVDHDLSFNTKTNQLPQGPESLANERNLRSPSLDLDSMYGFDPAMLKKTELGRRIYEDDGVRFRVGETGSDPDVNVTLSLLNDLPRNGDPNKPEAAAVVDPRNDENLAVAQTHLAFIKFHNAVVERLSKTLSGDALFNAARKTVVQHYQWIILKDYLPKIIEEGILENAIKEGGKHLIFQAGETPFVPFEFAMAGFRFGHSLVSLTYEWNRIFQSVPHASFVADLRNLLIFTGFGQQKLFNRKILPSSWVIDWTRFFDFKDFSGITNNPLSNQARKIGPSLISALTKLPRVLNNEEHLLRSLPVRNLIRGGLLGLPAGQCVARRLGVDALTPQQIKNNADNSRREILEQFGFDLVTPLWYYILKEAEEFHDGERLGPVGSQIIAETFVGLIRKSKVSILTPKTPGGFIWRPEGPDHLGIKDGEFYMTDLLYFVHRTFGNHLNPLGN